eukprot:Opistho-2@24253
MTIQDLKSQNLILFEVISGSKSFGLAIPTSDTDIKGVYYLPLRDFYGLHYIPQVSNETNDEVYYELGRFVELLLKNNPIILEILATPEDCILHRHPIMQRLNIKDFLSKLCKDSFVGYAVTQIKKARGLNKKIVNPIARERKSLLDFCYIIEGYESVTVTAWLADKDWSQQQCGLVSLPHAKGMYALFYDEFQTLGYRGIIKSEFSNEIVLSSIPKGEKEVAYLSCNLEGYSKYCKDYKEYWDWMEMRNEDRYNADQLHGKNYDSKNMMHTIRLLQTAEQILETGNLNIRVNNREQLLSIKSGQMDFDELIQMADDLMTSIDSWHRKSNLPETPDLDKAIEILIQMRETLYK